ncbi:DUF4349 domain-containing protein [Flavobacterium sp. AED]|uniref:DUF4349 domain-containing protein n=1 Tax=Flavobacterium sp. AED TaxID=1423323 RepID=UPI00057EC50D|nr:DUF4349 domain-containing protein [Flavobacterium sp. AED]KIA86446.1 hypothetical protein OA85_01885 [Flavobacterium sp. AED]MDI1306726.1 DUF4349 domain-containing protein [bacterium]
MKTIVKLSVASLVIMALLFSCKKGETPAEDAALESSTKVTDAISSSAAIDKKGDNRKFIRTADLKFKVKNVPQSTYAIENATNKFGGYVTYTNLQSTISDQIETKISQDSILETTKFSVENSITIRVPNTKLDTLIKVIAKQIAFLDYRLIKADDVSIQMIKNQLTQNRKANHQKRLEKAIDTKGKKLNDITIAESDLENQKEQNDSSTIENISLQDQVNLSTIKLQIYQPESLKQEKIANTKDKSNYQNNIGIEILDALKNGWYMLKEIIIFIFNLWAILLIGTIGFIVYKKYLHK